MTSLSDPAVRPVLNQAIVAINVATWRARHGKSGAAAKAAKAAGGLPRNPVEALRSLPVRRGR